MTASMEFSKLARDLHRMGPATRRRLGKAFRDAGQPMASDARQRASWSSRIPGAITVSAMTGGGERVGVTLRVGVSDGVPHARLYEGLGMGGSFRHPVFGHDRWVPQDTRPYAWPAVQAAADRLMPAINAAYEDAARECGFH